MQNDSLNEKIIAKVGTSEIKKISYSSKKKTLFTSNNPNDKKIVLTNPHTIDFNKNSNIVITLKEIVSPKETSDDDQKDKTINQKKLISEKTAKIFSKLENSKSRFENLVINSKENKTLSRNAKSRLEIIKPKENQIITPDLGEIIEESVEVIEKKEDKDKSKLLLERMNKLKNRNLDNLPSKSQIIGVDCDKVEDNNINI